MEPSPSPSTPIPPAAAPYGSSAGEGLQPAPGSSASGAKATPNFLDSILNKPPKIKPPYTPLPIPEALRWTTRVQPGASHAETLPAHPNVWVNCTANIGDRNNANALATALGDTEKPMVFMGQHAHGLLKQNTVDWYKIADRNPSTQILRSAHDIPDVLIDATHNDSLTGFDDYQPAPGALDYRPIFRVKIAVPDAPYRPNLCHGAQQIFAFTHQFDAEHPHPHDPRVVVLDTLPTRVTPARLAEEKAAWKDIVHLDGYARPLHVVALGERVDFDRDASLRDAKKLGEELGALVRRYGGTVVFTTSGRTQQVDETLRLAQAELPESARGYVYPYTPGPDSPYLALLANADHIIATDDSMSILSDALATPATRSVFVREPSGKETFQDSFQERYAQGMLARGDFYALADISNHPSHTLPNSPPARNSATEMAQCVRHAHSRAQQQGLGGV